MSFLSSGPAGGYPYPPQQETPEQIVTRFRAHGRKLALPVIALLLLAGLGGYFIGFFEQLWLNILIAVLIAAALIFAVIMPLLSWLASRTTITTKRVIVRSGLMTRSRSEVALTRLRTISSHRSLGQRLVGAGDIELTVAGGEPALHLLDVPAAKETAELLQFLLERCYSANGYGAAGYGTGGYGAGGYGPAGYSGDYGSGPARHTGFYTQPPQAQQADPQGRGGFTARRRM